MEIALNMYQKILANREKYVQISVDYLIKNKISIRQLAKDIGINAFTLKSFLEGKRKSDFITLCKVHDWIERNKP